MDITNKIVYNININYKNNGGYKNEKILCCAII